MSPRKTKQDEIEELKASLSAEEKKRTTAEEERDSTKAISDAMGPAIESQNELIKRLESESYTVIKTTEIPRLYDKPDASGQPAEKIEAGKPYYPIAKADEFILSPAKTGQVYWHIVYEDKNDPSKQRTAFYIGTAKLENKVVTITSETPIIRQVREIPKIVDILVKKNIEEKSD